MTGQRQDALGAQHPGLPAGGVQDDPVEARDTLVGGEHGALRVGDEAQSAEPSVQVADAQQVPPRIPRHLVAVQESRHVAQPSPAGPDGPGGHVAATCSLPGSLPAAVEARPHPRRSPPRFTSRAPPSG